MPIVSQSTVLAEAADVLSDQLRTHLSRLATLLQPHVARLEQQFLQTLKTQQFDRRQQTALLAITPGAAALSISEGYSPSRFFEQVEYNGRRLAKLNLPPSTIVGALAEYDRLLTPILRRLMPGEYANLQWVREQLQFCVILTLNNAYYQVREAETKAFYDLFRVELESRSLDELLERFLETLAQFASAEQARLFLLSEDCSHWTLRSMTQGGHSEESLAKAESIPYKRLARALKRPVCEVARDRDEVFPGDDWAPRFQSCWSIPLTDGQRTAGVLQFGFSKAYEWLPREQELLTAAAERCLMAIEKARLMENLAAREAQVRQLAEHMLHVEELERRRIRRELHDEAGQSLLCIRLEMEMLEEAMPGERQDLKKRLREVREHTEKTILEIRRLISALSPAVLEQLGLGAALRQLVNRFRQVHNARVKMHLGRLGNFPKNTEVIVYRLVQECFNNIAKHSEARTVNISLATADGLLSLSVEDDGIGFDIDEVLARRDTFGLAGIRERVTLLGGKFAVQSHPARDTGSNGRGAQEGNGTAGRKDRARPGTKILVQLPIHREGDAGAQRGTSSAERIEKHHQEVRGT